ncbi:uncharacterized protein BJX67DRAFT_352269 [Aspergillus lucknowensis]|uniref:Extracellular membrane protein CFEM domain-containing protein n=1 Tax=Aspergillus lucknowensis TaxID=176173 RepID=A0ABR4LTD3_9EURO
MSSGPDRCAHSVATPVLPWDNYCNLPLYQEWNATHDPLETLRGCCQSPDDNIGFSGDDNCTAYCNATEATLESLQTCLQQSDELQQFGCSSGAEEVYQRATAGRLGVYLVLGVVIASALGG